MSTENRVVQAVNPRTGEIVGEYPPCTAQQYERALADAAQCAVEAQMADDDRRAVSFARPPPGCASTPRRSSGSLARRPACRSGDCAANWNAPACNSRCSRRSSPPASTWSQSSTPRPGRPTCSPPGSPPPALSHRACRGLRCLQLSRSRSVPPAATPPRHWPPAARSSSKATPPIPAPLAGRGRESPMRAEGRRASGRRLHAAFYLPTSALASSLVERSTDPLRRVHGLVRGGREIGQAAPPSASSDPCVRRDGSLNPSL